MDNSKLSLFDSELIFIEDFKDQNDAFEKMAEKLLEKGLVNKEYLRALKERETEYPTGIDLSVVGSEIPNVAIPHTESDYCNDTKVILVKLKNGLAFKNMMDPLKELKVNYLFMILNKEGGEQANILANLMAFVTNKENMINLEKANTKEDIFKILQ